MSNTVIHVGQSAPRMAEFADFLDGTSPIVRRSAIEISEMPDGPVLLIMPPEADAHHWPLHLIRGVPDQAGDDNLVLALKDDPVSRLIVSDPGVQRILAARCPNLHKRPPVKGKVRLAAWSVTAIASVALIITVLVPVMADQLAEFLPPAGDRALGDSTFENIRVAMSDNSIGPLGICDNPEGVAAFEKMQARLEVSTDLPYPLTVHVLDNSLINAFALPGGHIVFFRGLIDEAENPDEIAAVFAHELGHVVRRDPTRGALRSAGSVGVLGLVFGDFAGGAAVLFMMERLIEATYNQDAEAAADTFAHKALLDAGIPPSALGTMFDRLRKKQGDDNGIVAHFLSHPSLGDRIEAANKAADGMTGPIRPSLSDFEWDKLRKICR